MYNVMYDNASVCLRHQGIRDTQNEKGVVFLIDEKMYNTRIIDKGKDNDRKI
jgi:hypothetical protein